MGLRSTVMAGVSTKALAVALAALLATMGWASAKDDETVVVRLTATRDGDVYGLMVAAAPEILPCYAPNRPSGLVTTDPVIVGTTIDPFEVVFEGRWWDPLRYIFEPPDDGTAGEYTPPSVVTMYLTVPWTGDFTMLTYYASPDDAEKQLALLELDLSDAIASYEKAGGRDQTGLTCQQPEGWAAQLDQVDTDARIDEALKAFDVEDPR